MASQTVTATPTPTSYSGTAANVDWGGTASGFTIPAGNSILGIKFLLVGAGYDNGIMFAQTLVVNGKDLSSYVNPSGTVDYWGDGAIHASSPTQLWGQLWTRAEVNADLAIAVRSYNTPAAAYNAALTGIQAVVYYDVTTTDPAHTTASVPAGIVGATTEIVVTARDSSNVPRGVGGDTVVVTVTGANSATPTVTDNGDGTYTAHYTPTTSGSDSVAITIGGTAISGSPYTSTVTGGGGITVPYANRLTIIGGGL